MDMVFSLGASCEYELLRNGFVQNIPDNICTDMVSLLCESEYGLSGRYYVKNVSDNIHTDTALCVSLNVV